MSLKAIFFDIDDTLTSTTGYVRTARRAGVEAMRRHGLRMPVGVLLRKLEKVAAEFPADFDLHFEKLLQRLPRKAFGKVNPAILLAAAVRARDDAKGGCVRPYPDVTPVMKRLARTRLILGVITAGRAVPQAEKLLRTGLYGFFDPEAIFISEQVGFSKPDVKLYRRACEEMGVKPREAMYVGDRRAHDIDPANRLGFTTVLVRRGEKYMRERGRSRPDHEVKDLQQLLILLREVYKVRA